MITLTAGDLHLEILPHLGGAITRFSSGDFQIFRQTQNLPGTVSDCASFPLIPFSNRIRAGRFSFAGTAYQIPTDRRDARFTNHGHTRHHSWEVINVSATDLTLRFVHRQPSDSWPFPFTAEQQFSLSPNGLNMQARIRNDHAAAAPAGIGFHPYFTRAAGTELSFLANCVWDTDALDIPIRSARPADAFDFSTRKPIAAPINHAYGGWNRKAEIIHPGLYIVVNASEVLDHLILFTPGAKNFFGFEPVSHRPDALNPLSDGNDQGMAVLAPGESLAGGMEITIAQ